MVKLLKGNGRFDFNIVGESHGQNDIQRIVGKKISGGHDYDCLAALVYDEKNQYDKNAVAVCIVYASGSIVQVGFLSRQDAVKYRKNVSESGGLNPEGMLCRAKIVGGWSDAGDEGHFGVRLDLLLPLTFGTAASWPTWSQRLLQ